MSFINKKFQQVRRNFVITIVSLAVASVAGLGIILYETNAIRFNNDVSSEQLHSVVAENDAVVEYLDQEKESEAHFISIANLLKSDQQQTLGRSLIFVTVPIVLAAGLAGYLIARRLLGPVQESYESQERFIQDAAHELRNPLAAMSLAIENAENKGGRTDLTKTMTRQTKRLVRINEDLLFLERRSSSEEAVDVDLSELVQDVIEDMQVHINKKSLNMKLQIQEGVVKRMLPHDFVRLSKNIIENAIKYTPKGKKIMVTLKTDGSKVVFKVVDQGIGIPEDDLARIGERFFRSKNVSRTVGSGLGMAIVQKIVDRYGGEISLKSQINKGTTVEIHL
ncbi:MAG: HAMP domain-containing sensor histidine kinase [Candidatus Saccharimonadales bacterium]|nr:HAMP domain-containing sensor histidine kinase [Candidatus Saccharimonadales bacterium]